MTKPLVDLGALFSEADHTFDEIMLFRHGFRNDTEIFAFTAYKCSIWNGRKTRNCKHRRADAKPAACAKPL